MTLTQLRYYQTVCKFNSISKASQFLHVSQPAISIAINNLEKEFNLIFFKRDNRTFTITEAGSQFLTLTNELLSNVDAVYHQMEILQGNKHPLRLSVVPFAYAHILRPLLQEHHTCYPDEEILTYEYNATDAIRHLKNDSIDIALTVDLQEYSSAITGLKLFQTSSILAVGKRHPLAQTSCCQFSDLANESLIFAKENSYLTRQVKNRFHALSITPNIVLYTAHVGILESFLQDGHSAAIVSQSLAQQLKNVTLIPIADSVEITRLLLWKQAPVRSKSISRFIKTVRTFYTDAQPMKS